MLMAFGRNNKPAEPQRGASPSSREQQVIGPGDVGNLPEGIVEPKNLPATSITDTGPATNGALMPRTSTELSAEAADEFQGGDTGLENVTGRDLLIPRITILQDLSPQVKKNKPEFIEGAEIGDFCDTAAGEVFKEMLLLPCYFAVINLEWAPRATGKGLIANHGTSREIFKDSRQDEKRRWFHGENLVSETMTFYCLNVTAGGRRCFVPMASTSLKSGRAWLTRITNERVRNPRTGAEFQPPIFYRSWIAKVTEESNNQGSWFGWKLEPGPTVLEIDPTKTLLVNAKDFLEQARSGLVSGDLSSYADDGTDAGAATTAGSETGTDATANSDRAM